MQPVRLDRELQTVSFAISSMVADGSPQLPCHTHKMLAEGFQDGTRRSSGVRAERPADRGP